MLKEMSFNFKCFQVIEGTFTLPESIISEKIQLSPIVTKTKWQKYNKLDQTPL
jgi:hypothetical protein